MRLTHEQWIDVNARAAELAGKVQESERILEAHRPYPVPWSEPLYQMPHAWMNYKTLPPMPYAVERREYVLGFAHERTRTRRISLVICVKSDGSLTLDRWHATSDGPCDLSPLQEVYNEQCPLCRDGEIHTQFMCVPPRAPKIS